MESTQSTNNQNALQVFNFKDQQVEVIIIDGEPHFIGKQVATILGYTDTDQALRKHVDAEDKLTRRFDGEPNSKGGNPNKIVINESGLYSLIMGSKLERAKEFKRWVTSEVLPSIRKHGIYATGDTIDKMIDDPDFGIKLLQQLKEERERRINLQNRVGVLEDRVAVQGQQIAEMNPKAAYYDMILNAKGLVSITTIAKDYGMSGTKMNELLHEHGIQWKQNKTWVLYQQYADKGYTNTKTHEYQDNNGEYKVVVHTYWTQKGRLFIYETLKRQGILPKIEREGNTAA